MLRMDRRELLRGGVGAALLLCLPTLDLRALDSQSLPSLPEFSDVMRQLAATIADVLIPRTDTPGAVDVGVVAFTEHLVRYTDRASFDRFIAGAKAFEAAAAHDLGTPFATAAPDIREGYVQRLDERCFSGVPVPPAAGFLLALKRLTVLGYYTAEAGARAELDVQPFPGPFRGAVPLETQPKTYYEDSLGVPTERPPGYLRA